MVYDLPGRHADMSQSNDKSDRQLSWTTPLTRRTRLSDQHEEITAAVFPVNSVFGLHGGLPGDISQAHQITTACNRAQQVRSLLLRQLARLIGKTTATIPTIRQAPLCTEAYST